MLSNMLSILKKYGFLSLSFILLSSTIDAQHFITKEFDRHLYFLENKLPSDSLYLIITDYPTTGIALHIREDDCLSGCYIIVDIDTLYFQPDFENARDKPVLYSNLYTFPVPIDSFLFNPGNLKYPVNFVFINAQMPKNNVQSSSKKKSDDCSEPEMIDQSVWREGLSDPDYERIPNEVYNVIIHHSAGSNTDTNYIQVVRSIYIYHTEVRNWSDIGYNYLIAQNGEIFKGRDPGSLEQDNVLGAHFCASNTGTLGVCVLGNYMEIAPPIYALESLIDLITWKLGKDSLDPLGTYPHPLNPHLHVIAGHRDGCATDCPGDSLYILFTELRTMVMQKFNDCGYFIKLPATINELSLEFDFTISDNELIIYDPTGRVKKIGLFDLLGRPVLSLSGNKSSPIIRFPLPVLKPGIYILSIFDGKVDYTYKIAINL